MSAFGKLRLAFATLPGIDAVSLRHLVCGVCIVVAALGCGSGAKTADFVGKWQSSRLSTPLLMHSNGEWEVLREDGSTIQYGVWQYLHNELLWSFQQGGQLGHDANPVLSVSPKEFRLRERDGTTTVFRRID